MGERTICKCCGTECDHTICQNCFLSFFLNSPERVSFAFETRLPNFSKLKQVKVLDLFRTSVATININDFPELTMLRVSRCINLTKVHLTNVPSLIVLDLSANKELTSISIDECVSSIISLDLSYCENLTTMPITSYESVQYVSIRHTRISELAEFPKTRYLDISSTYISDLSNVEDMKELEIIVLDHMLNIDDLDMSMLTYLPKLRAIQSDIQNVSFPNWNPDTHLSQIWLQNCKNVSDLEEILTKKEQDNPENITFDALLPNNVLLGNKFKDKIIYDPHDSWHRSCRLLYGPWPSPPCYQKPLRVIHYPDPLPERYPVKKVISSIAGAIFGASVADTIMLFVERQTPEFLNFFLEGNLDITWSHPRVTRRGVDYCRGGITDNAVNLMLTIRTLISKGSDHIASDLSKRIKEYLLEGLPELPLSVLSAQHPPSVSKIVRDKNFNSDPVSAAKKYWENSGETPNGNDALTRSVITGCFVFWDEDKVAANAEKLCRITHYDPRCAFSSVCLALMISRLIRRRCGEIESIDINKLVDDSVKYVNDLTPYMVSEIHKFTHVDDLSQLNLKNYSPLVLQAIGCAIWALKMDYSYVEGLETIVRAGGDASTNSFVLGAVIGAKDGLGGIPIDLMQYFWKGAGIHRDIVALFKAMKIDFKMPEYEEYFQMV